MNIEWLYLFAGAIALSALGFVCVAVLWLRKLRDAVSSSMTEAAGQQILNAQRLGDTVARLQKQQDNYTKQINVLAQAGMRLQQELSTLSSRLDHSQEEGQRSGRQTLH